MAFSGYVAGLASLAIIYPSVHPVQDVLDRAGVGRSIFYTHYRDKEELFMSNADEFFEAISNHLTLRKDAFGRVVLVAEFFAHVAEMQWLLHAPMVVFQK